ncbi:hypothetical protein QQ045_032834 [Rhodiola kirilowii]
MSTAANGISQYDGSGAGGKFRRKPIRKSQATPYDRPPIAVRNPSSGNGWLSKIIDPASKIITASAHRLFSSVFRKRLLPPPQQTPPHPVATQPASVAADVGRTSDAGSKGEIQDIVGYTDQHQYGTGHPARDPDSLLNNGVSQGLYELEKILEKKTFTKSEIDRLTALLSSRTIEAPAEDDKKTKEARESNTGHTDGNLIEPKCTPVVDNGVKTKKYLAAISSPIANTKVVEEDIASPAELAKAYMGRRSSKVSPSMLGSRGQAIRNDLPLVNHIVFPSQSPSRNTATRSPTRVIAPQNGYMTPRARGRTAIYSMARTPYSRMQKSSDIRSGIIYNFQSSTLALEEPNKLSSSRQMTLKRRSSVLDDDIGSVGPIRRTRQKPGLLPSQGVTGPGSRNTPVNEPRVVSNNRSKDAANGTSDANIMSVPSQSSEVAQKILQQLDKLAPSPKERLSERKSMQPQGKSPFTLSPDMLTGQAFRSLENVDSSKFIESSQEDNKPTDSVQRGVPNYFTTLNDKNQVEENGPKKMTTILNSNSETALYLSGCPLAKNKRAFQMSAHEAYLDLDDNYGKSNGASSTVSEDKVSRVNSSLEDKPQRVKVVAGTENSVSNDEKTNVSKHLDIKKCDRDQAASDGSVIAENKDKGSYSAGSRTMTIQPTVTGIASSSVFGKLSSGEQSTTTSLFGHGAKIADKSTPSTFSSSLMLDNDSLAKQTSAPSELKTSDSSIISNSAIIKPDDKKGAQGTGDREGDSSTASLNAVSATSTLLSTDSYANNGFSNGSFSVQPATASAPLSNFKNVNDGGGHTLNSSATLAFPTSFPNTAPGITSGDGGSLFMTSAAPFSAAPGFSSGPSFKKDPLGSANTDGPISDVEETGKSVTAVSNMFSNPFGGLSSGTLNSTNVISCFGSSMSSPEVDNQGLGSVNDNDNAIGSQAPAVGTAAAASVSKSILFQLGSSGSAPTFGVSGTATFAPASAAHSVSAPAPNIFSSNTPFGLNNLPSSKEISIADSNSTGGSINSLFGSNWQSNSSPIFGSTTSSSTTLPSVFSAASSASIPTSSMPGSLFGSTGPSAGSTFSFTSASASTSPSPFSAPQPVFGSPNPVFAFGSAASPANNGSNNNQMSIEDTMAEDTVQASAPTTPVFGQQQSSPNPGFMFGSPFPSVTQSGTSLFQFGGQPSTAASANHSPIEASGSFNAGGSFSLGTGGGDKSRRRIIRVKKGPKRG